MASIKIVTDSGADIPRALVDELDIHIVPLTIHLDDEEFTDGVDLQPAEFYARLEKGQMPRTTQPSPADFEAAFKQIQNEADAIVSIHLSSEISGTMQSARLAGDFDGITKPVHVVDGRSASLGHGLLAIEAARMAKDGASVDEILETLDGIVKRQQVLFLPDTLEYLQRNGRIGRASAFVGGLLNIKPLLHFDEGVVSPLERIRGKNRAVARMLDVIAEDVGSASARIGIIHGNAPSEAEQLAEQMRSRLNVHEMFVSQLGPTIGAHGGPGILGIVYHTV